MNFYNRKYLPASTRALNQEEDFKGSRLDMLPYEDKPPYKDPNHFRDLTTPKPTPKYQMQKIARLSS